MRCVKFILFSAVAVVENPGLHITGARIPGIVDMWIGLHGKTMGKTMGPEKCGWP